ncbi:MAG: hypothetical protein JW841_07005 [Deltaproteobacteria bacterium]|nr:hypothetical protein [Deltaproteobacteria bacterium]
MAKDLTTIAVNAEQLESHVYTDTDTDKRAFVSDVGLSDVDLERELILPPRKDDIPQKQIVEYDDDDSEKKYPRMLVEHGAMIKENWERQGDSLLREKWRFSILRQIGW